MHYVLVWWFNEKFKPLWKGCAGLIVCADELVVCFQYKSEARNFYKLLLKRMSNFGLQLWKEKCRLIEFDRFAQVNANEKGEKPKWYDFLGFTHYCPQCWNGRFRVKRKTSKNNMKKKCKEVHNLLKKMRQL